MRWIVCAVCAAAAALAAGSSAALAASPTKGATYEHVGAVSDDTAVSIHVSRTGKGLADIDLAMSSPCSNGRDALGILVWVSGAQQPARVRVARDGSFAATIPQEGFLLDPFTVTEEYSISGRFIRRGRAARVVLHAREVGEAGTVCDSGDRRVTARRTRARPA